LKDRIYLGFDYGEKNIGVAVGHSETGMAQPLTCIKVVRSEPAWQDIAELIEEWKPDTLVLGLPLNMDGSPSATGGAARAFGQRLHDRYNLPVTMVDERLTTNAALNSLTDAGVASKRQKQKKDMLAAQIILQSFLNDSLRSARDDER
jgi:putative Holliday junction resolvase